MTSSNELGYHWINKNSLSTSLASATGIEATAVRRHIQKKAKARTQNPKDVPVAAPSPKGSLVCDTTIGQNQKYDNDGDGKSRRQKSKIKVAYYKHHIGWRLRPSPASKKTRARDPRTAPSVTRDGTAVKLDSDSSDRGSHPRELADTSIAAYPGAGRIDAGTNVTNQELPVYGREVLDFAVNYFWPAFIPTRTDPQRHPVKAEWLKTCKESPMTFSVFLLAAAEAHLMTRGGVESKHSNRLWRMTFHSAAIRHVNEYISALGPTKEPSDEILACILTLACWTAETPKNMSKSESALAHAQNLDSVSQRPYVQAHKDALYYLIQRKGGIHKIKMYGVSMLIQATDILWSTQDQRPPRLPWSQETPMIPFALASVPQHRKNKLQRLASGFFRIPSIAISPAYIEVIQAVRNLIIALDAAEKTGTVATYLPELVVMRNWVQHRLLSLTSISASASPGETPAPKNDPYILEAVRVSLLILSSFVVFPQPHSDAGQPLRLNAKLLEALDGCIREFGDNGADALGTARSTQTTTTRLLAWASMLGAINCPAETASIQRAGFVTVLFLSCGRLGMDMKQQEHGWVEAMALLGLDEFLWRSQELDGPAKGVWREVTRLGAEGW